MTSIWVAFQAHARKSTTIIPLRLKIVERLTPAAKLGERNQMGDKDLGKFEVTTVCACPEDKTMKMPIPSHIWTYQYAYPMQKHISDSELPLAPSTSLPSMHTIPLYLNWASGEGNTTIREFKLRMQIKPILRSTALLKDLILPKLYCCTTYCSASGHPLAYECRPL